MKMVANRLTHTCYLSSHPLLSWGT